MIDFTIETQIDAPVHAVFAYATDPATLSTWQTNTVSAVADGPIGLGTRIDEVHAAPGGKQLKSVVEVVAYELDRRFALKVVEGSLPVDADLTFTAIGAAQTTLAFRVHGRPAGALKLLQPVLRRTLRKQFAEHCANLRRLLEQPGA